MSTATMSSIHSPSQVRSHKHSSSRSSRPSTTPRGLSTPFSVDQSTPPTLSPKSRSPHGIRESNITSPSYFGLVVDNNDSIPTDSQPGRHARQNWNFPTTAQDQTVSPRHVSTESTSDFEAFRRQSERGSFSLNSSFSSQARPPPSRTNSETARHLPSHVDSPTSPRSSKPQLQRSYKTSGPDELKTLRGDDRPMFNFPRQESPQSMTPVHTIEDHQLARLSLPASELSAPAFKQAQRADTLPHPSDNQAPQIVHPKVVADLLKDPEKVLALDLRVYQQYLSSRIRGSLNLCIPTTLLKRPAFTTQKLSDTFSSEADREKFETWKECKYIVVYDANSSQAKEAVMPFNVLKKFSSEGWKGTGLVVKGGFQSFTKFESDWVEKGPREQGKGQKSPLSISTSGPEAVPVAGGCAMPSAKSAANPFFGNIRQNMDLLDGVGQMSVKKPKNMSERAKAALPEWLQKASRSSDEGKVVSAKFLSIERSEQKRMQQALTAKVQYGTPAADSPKQVQVAGIEKGSKNRYNNIFPFDHTRVRLQGCPDGDCDYVNASHVKAEYSNRHYIATQAPIPGTFKDFWRVVWEQDVRVIVMLTAEAEGGQVKSHPYWNSGEYGPLKLKKLSEKTMSLDPKPAKTPQPSSARPSFGPRRSTTHYFSTDSKPTDAAVSPGSEAPSVTIRAFSLAHPRLPGQPVREVTQIQYTQWPDFGAPASPTAILNLIEHVNRYIRGSASAKRPIGYDEPAPERERPVVVHCSAGCGRTGTFCTIDSVIDMLKRQKQDQKKHDTDRMDLDDERWIQRDDEDLVAKAVSDFRQQRLSMVQNLRQFVLCYESVLQWVASHEA